MGKLKVLLGLLIEGEPLPASYLDHPLKEYLAAILKPISVSDCSGSVFVGQVAADAYFET